MEAISGIGELISALFAGDAFMLQDAMRNNPAIWPLGLIVTLVGGALVAWIYVGLRIFHSVYQATVNVVKVRFLLFLISTIALTVLAVRAVIATVFADPSALPQ